MSHPIDIYVGKRVRLRRKLLGLTQSDLANKLDITFQQIQKYEKGENRISASKLYEIGATLGNNVAYFFDGYEPQEESVEAENNHQDISILDNNDAIQLVRSFSTIKNSKLQKKLLSLIATVSE
jgi:transcriptional regulator with XRE-family HTH domain